MVSKEALSEHPEGVGGEGRENFSSSNISV